MARKFKRRRYAAGRAGDHAQHRTRRRWPWITLACVVVLLGLTAAVGLVFAKQAISVKDDLTAAKTDLKSLGAAVKTGDSKTLQATAAHVLLLTTRASKTTEGPLWDIAAGVPVVGQNVAAIQDATQAVHILAKEAMPPAVKLLSTLNLKTIKTSGGLNLSAVKAVVPVLPQISTAFDHASEHVSGIDRAQLNPVVDDAIGQLLDVIAKAGPALGTAQDLLPTLIDMAGGNGERLYMVLFQNNAEIRATGGNPANTAEVKLDNGKVTMLDDASTKAFKVAEYTGVGTPYPIPEETLALYERDFTSYAQNYTRTPDFPTSAQMFTGLWNKVTGGEVDGVISIDPVVLSYMLAATGPVTLADGSKITSGNAVKLLLSDAYEKYGSDGKAADRYFGDVASRVFKKVSSGHWDMTKMLAALQKGVDDQRIYTWFPRAKEQALSVEYKTDGTLLKSSAKTSQVGVYLNDSAHSKLTYYLKTKTAVTCNAAKRTVTTTVTMTSTVPGPNLSGYTLGWRNNSLGIPRTTMMLDVLAFALPGGKITSTPENGDFYLWNRIGVEQGRDGRSITVQVPMGQTKKVAYTSTVPEGAHGPLEVRYSPTTTKTPVSVAPNCAKLFPAK